MSRCISIAAVLLLAAAGAAQASDPAFPRGTQDFGLNLGYSFPIANDQEQYSGVQGEFGYYLLDNLAIVPALAGYYVDARDATGIIGADFTLSLRWHFFETGRFTTFATVTPGVAYFDHPLPFATDTRFNFHIGVGLGATYRLTDNVHLVGGVETTHLSNANIEGSDRHEGSNSIRTYIGLLWTFK